MLQRRRSDIIEKVKTHRMVKVADLVRTYGVSVETIRRDLEYLEKEGYLKRVYGGAVLHGLYEQEPEYIHREVVHLEEKRAIAQRTAQLIEDGDTLFIDVGTTTLEVAHYLKEKRNLTVITNAILIAQEMIQYHNCRVILLGGELRGGELSVSGFLSDLNLKNFYANKMIMSVGGIAVKSGVTHYHFEEANTRRLMLEQCGQVIAVADHSKLGATTLNHVCALEYVDTLVTDWAAPPKLLKEYRDHGMETIVATHME